jgi:FkbH-like protein
VIATDHPARVLGDLLDARQDELLALWDRLGEAGPTYGSPDAGEPDVAHARYLLPLARVLIGALRGSEEHKAVYLDERTRYLDAHLDAGERSAFLRTQLAAEARAIAGLLAADIDAEAVASLLGALHVSLTDPPATTARVLFIGDCLFVETRAFLVPLAQRRDRAVDVRQVFFSARQPAESVNTAIVDEVREFGPDVIGLSLFTFEGVPPYASAWRQAAMPVMGAKALDVVDGLVELVRATIADIRSVSDATIAVHVPAGLPLHPVRRRLHALPPHSRAQQRFLDALSGELHTLVDATENTIVLAEDAAVQAAGGVRAAAGPAFAPDDVPEGYFHTTRLGPGLAGEYDDLLGDHELLARAKALFVDFDNTLWSGLMGDGDVVHDVEAQRLLLELRNAGVLLIALSKNDAASIRWDELALAPEDFVLHKINWDPKPDNVSASISELDLAPDAFVLLDDNPVERALVTEQVPGVRALDPAEPGTWRALRRWLEFPSTKQTDEARQRTQMYREAAERRAATVSGRHDYGAMMESLGLRYRVRRATRDDLPRLLELIQRTNQFNTTTRRRSAAEVTELLQAPRAAVYVGSLRDRFGDLGVVCAVVFDVAARTFDSFIMSCRAMGFGLETAMLREVMDEQGPGPVRGLFVPSERNVPASRLFSGAGFRSAEDGVWLLGAEDERPAIPGWLRAE